MAKVWVVFREYQSDTPEIIGVYTHESAAEAARRAEVQEHLSEGTIVERMDDDEEETYDDFENFDDAGDWEVDINIEEVELDESVPGPEGRVRDIEQAHRDATMEAWAREMTPEAGR